MIKEIDCALGVHYAALNFNGCNGLCLLIRLLCSQPCILVIICRLAHLGRVFYPCPVVLLGILRLINLFQHALATCQE